MSLKIKIAFFIVLIFAVLAIYLRFFAPKSIFNIGMNYEDRGQFGEALLCYDIAIFLDGKLPKAHFRRGRMILNSGYIRRTVYRSSNISFINDRYNKRTDFQYFWQASYDDFQKAIINEPRDVNNYLFLGTVCLSRSMYNEAYNSFNIAINIDSRNLFAYFGRAMSSDFNSHYERDRKRNNELALQDYSIVIQNLNLNAPSASENFDFNFRITVEAWEVFKLRAELYKKMGKIKEAIIDIDQAIKLSPGPDVHLLYELSGELKIEIGDYVGAIKCYDKIIEMNRHVATDFFARAHAKKEIGDLQGYEDDIGNGKKFEEETRVFELKRRQELEVIKEREYQIQKNKKKR